MATDDRIYFARRAAEEQELAAQSPDPEVADAIASCSASISSGPTLVAARRCSRNDRLISPSRRRGRGSFSSSKVSRFLGRARSRRG